MKDGRRRAAEVKDGRRRAAEVKDGRRRAARVKGCAGAALVYKPPQHPFSELSWPDPAPVADQPATERF